MNFFTNINQFFGLYFYLLMAPLCVLDWYLSEKRDKATLLKVFSDLFNFALDLLVLTFLIGGSFKNFTTYQIFHFENNVIVFVLAILLYDLYFYFEHVVKHKWTLIWLFHHVHHSSDRYGLSIGFRLSWLRSFLKLAFIVPFFVLGFEMPTLAAAMALVNVYAFLVHTGFKFKIPRYLSFFVSPYQHAIHHEIGAEKGFNFGGMFNIWDKIFGTHMAESITPNAYGVRGYKPSLNPVLNQTHPFLEHFFDKKPQY